MKIYNSDFELKCILKNPISDNLKEEINGIYEYDFTDIISDKIISYIENGIINVDNNYFDVVEYELSISQQGNQASVKSEHISYRLNNIIIESLSYSHFGDLKSHLDILFADDPLFNVGSVQNTISFTYTLSEDKTKRMILYEIMQLAEAEIYFDGFNINAKLFRGDQNGKIFTNKKNIQILSKKYNKKTEDGIPIISYQCTPIANDDIEIGDKALVFNSYLGISEEMRIITIERSIEYNKVEYIELSNREIRIEDTIAKIITEKIAKDSKYYGVSIGPSKGIEIEASDKKSRSVFNADFFKMQSGSGDGNYIDKVYFDPLLGEFVFDGNIYADDGVFSGDVIAGTITGGTITGAEINGGTVTGTQLIGGSIDIGSGNFVVDTLGNLTANSASLKGEVTGSLFNTYSPGDYNYIEINDEGFKGYEYVSGIFEKNGLCIDSSSWADTNFFYRGTKYFNIKYSPVGVSFSAYNITGTLSYEFLFAYDNYALPNGNWDFVNCDSISNLFTDTKGLHNHGITNGTKLATSSDGINIDGNVTWVESGDHYHDVTV